MRVIRTGGALLCLLIAASGATGPGVASAGNSTPCFDVRVEYLGRTPVQNIDNIQYYRWCYRVYGQGCMNRSLSHWVLGMCSDALNQLSAISTESNDVSDMPGGTITNYVTALGKDPTTGLTGLKWNTAGGNALDKPGEYDDFCFVASGSVSIVTWAAKGGTFVQYGTTLGPGCQPVATQPVSWGAIKAMYR